MYSNPAAEGDRTSVTASVFPKGDVLVGFADGKAGSKRARVTVLNLKVHAIDAEKGLLLVKGAVPGAKGRLVFVRTAVKGA